MLRVTVEIVPFGDDSRAKKIGQINIINRGDNDASPVRGNYTYLVEENDILHDGKVENFLRSRGWVSLLAHVLDRWRH